MSIVRDYRKYDKPREVYKIVGNKQLAYVCPECADNIAVWRDGEDKPQLPDTCGHCGCKVFDPEDDDIKDIHKKIAEAGE